MRAEIAAGFAYFVIVFAIGVALGFVRVVALDWVLGPTMAVLVELPAILVASWFAARGCVALFDVPPALPERFLMGALAFLLLIGAEIILGVFGFGRTFAQQFATFREPPAALGLAGQIVFGLFPIVQMRIKLAG